MFRSLRVALCAGLFPALLPAQTTTPRTPPGGTPRVTPRAPAVDTSSRAVLPVDPAVRIGTLFNGLKYYVRRNAKPEKRAELRLVVNAGSILEDDDQRGLAHFIEHMAFNGTKSFAKNDIVKYLESIGVRFGADLNAYTSFDETVYILPVPTDSAGILDKSLRFLRDVASGVLFDSTEVVAERGVVLSEWRDGLGAGSRLRDKQLPVIFKGSRYADRLTIGLPAILEKANPSTLKRYWRDWYRPDLMAVVAVGDADPAKLEALIRSNFGGIPKRVTPRPRTYASVPSHDSTLVSIATDKELTTATVQVLWKRPATSSKTVKAYRTQLAEQLYQSILNQRFSEIRLRPDAPFTGAGSGSGRFVRTAEVSSLSAGAKDGKVLESLQSLLIESERMQRFGALPAEVERAKTNLLRSYEQAYAERDKSESAQYVEEYVTNFLEQEPIPGISYEYQLAKALLPTLTLAEVNAVGQAQSGSANRVVTIAMPENGAKVPSESDVRGVFGKVLASSITPWTETVAEGALVPSAPTPGKIVAERTIAGPGITEWMLSNGIRVLVKPTDFNNDQVLMTAWSPGGGSLVSDAEALTAALAASIIQQGGVGSFSAIDLRKKLTGKVANVSAQIGDLSEGLSGSASPRDLETMLQLAWLRVTAPRADSAVFKAFLQQYETVIKNKDANPQLVFQDTIQMTLGAGHPRVRPLSLAMLKEFDLGRMLALYKDRFADVGDMTVVFVGNVDLATLKPLVAQWIATLPSTGRKESWKETGPKPLAGQVTKLVKKGLEPTSSTIVLLSGTAPYSREQAYLLSSLSDLAEMRLLDRLREALGGTYSVNVSGNLSRRPREEWQFSVQYGSAPDKAESMFAALEQELDSLRRVPPSAAELERVKEQQRREFEVQLKQNGYWLSSIRTRAEYGDPLETMGDYLTLVNGLTADKLFAAAKQYLNEANRARFVLLPEK
jgi:zinc protease